MSDLKGQNENALFEGLEHLLNAPHNLTFGSRSRCLNWGIGCVFLVK